MGKKNMSKELPTWLVVIGMTLLAVELAIILYAVCWMLPHLLLGGD